MREEAKPEISELIQENRNLLYYVIRPIVGNENLVDDCYGEVSEIIVKKYDTYDADKGSLTAIFVAGLLICNVAFHYTPLEWQESEPADSRIVALRSTLEEKGFRKDLLSQIADEDLEDLSDMEISEVVINEDSYNGETPDEAVNFIAFNADLFGNAWGIQLPYRELPPINREGGLSFGKPKGYILGIYYTYDLSE